MREFKYRSNPVTIVSFCKDCKITDFDVPDVMSSTLVKTPGSDQKDSLIIELQSIWKKNSLYSQRKLLKKCKERVFINECLTKADSLIFKKARTDVKNGSLFAAWTFQL